jgi:hypothetical protein
MAPRRADYYYNKTNQVDLAARHRGGIATAT